MATVYSTLFVTVHAGAGGSFSVDATHRCVIREITVFNANGVLSRNAELVHDASDCTIYQRAIGAKEWYSDQMRFVGNPGDSFTLLTDPDVDMTISGYLLTLP
jgi:hypothetical protein